MVERESVMAEDKVVADTTPEELDRSLIDQVEELVPDHIRPSGVVRLLVRRQEALDTEH